MISEIVGQNVKKKVKKLSMCNFYLLRKHKIPCQDFNHSCILSE